MNNETLKRIHQIYNVILSIVIVITGICLMSACLGIYRSGDQPYSREAIAAAFAPIALPVYLCIAMIVLGFVYEWICPTENKRMKTPKAYLHTIKQLRNKKDLAACNEDLRTSIEKEVSSRRLHRTVSMIILGLCSVLFLIYALNGAHFHQSEINTSMIQAMYRLLPCVVVSFGYGIFTLYHNRTSMEREIELLKQVPALKTASSANDKLVSEVKQNEQQYPSDNKIRIFRNVFLCLSLFLLIYGFISGGTADVLTKAINICTECIGLG